MASPGGPLVPFSPAECPPGVCNAYCPQGCYAFFPPPPPLGFGPDDSSGRNLSPLVIALISILASAFLLVSYYLLISRYCGGSFDSLRRRLAHDDGGGGADESGGVRGDAWQTPPPSAAGGLEEWVIRSIAVCRYKRGDGLVEGTDCSVCLSEFRDGESLRLLPDCCHAFHVSCIDTWLKSHSNCPVCRANIIYTFTTPSPSPPPRPPLPPPRPPPPPHVAAAPPPRRGPAVPEIRHDSAAVQEIGRGGEREDRCGVERGGVPVRKENPLRRHGVIELTEEGIQSNRPSSEGDFLPPPPPPPPPNDGTVQEVGSSRGFRAEQHAYKVSSGNRMLHCVIVNPSPAKGFLASGGMSCFAGQGKENRGILLPL